MITILPNNKVPITPVKVDHSSIFGPPVSLKKVSESKKANFSCSVRPIYYFSRAFGLCPFTLVYDSNGDIQEARVTTLDIIWFLISTILYLFMAFFCYANMHRPQDTGESQILLIGDYAHLIFGLINGAIMVSLDMFNRHKFIDFIKKIITFDKEVCKLFTFRFCVH